MTDYLRREAKRLNRYYSIKYIGDWYCTKGIITDKVYDISQSDKEHKYATVHMMNGYVLGITKSNYMPYPNINTISFTF